MISLISKFAFRIQLSIMIVLSWILLKNYNLKCKNPKNMVKYYSLKCSNKERFFNPLKNMGFLLSTNGS